MPEKIDIPVGLSPAMRRYYREICEKYVMENHHRRKLQMGCEAWDDRKRYRDFLATNGRTYTDNHGVIRPRPEVAMMNKADLLFLRVMRELNLDTQPEESRMPDLRQFHPRRAV